MPSAPVGTARHGTLVDGETRLEQQWEGKTIGIGYEVDVEVGHIILTLQPDDQPELSLNVTVDISGVFVGVGDEN